MSPSAWVAIGLALTTAMAWARLVAWAMGTPTAARTRSWRLAILLAAQPLLALLLYLSLFPPGFPAAGTGTLDIATRGAVRQAASAGEPRIVLPEAPPGVDGEAAPDLATALRRHPGVARLRILGDGLEPRDQDAAAALPLLFTPPRELGLTELHSPPRVAPGAAFQVAGTVQAADGGVIELLDPAGRVVDAQPLPSAGGFVLRATARDPGPALFAVRIRDRRHGVIEVAEVPVWIAADPGPSVLLLAGAAGPEVKQLRRWALDAGVALQASVGAGDGLELGEAPPRLDAAALDRIDLVVVDERSWAALGAGERAALIAATRGGMGLLLRITGPVPETVRQQWAALGLPLGSGEETAEVRLASHAPPPVPSTAEAAPADVAPPMTRRVVDVPVPGSVPLTPDAAAAALGRWRAVGRGRAGVWWTTDSSGLVTAGFADRYGELWSAVFDTLARTALQPAASADPPSADLPRAGQRLSICGIGDGAEVFGPDGGVTRLYVDPAAGPGRCAGYWPLASGWRLVRAAGAKGTARPDRPLYVYAADAMPGVRARALRDGTWRIASTTGGTMRSGAAPISAGPAWPWLLLLLAVLASVWRFERASTGRVAEADGSGLVARPRRRAPAQP